MPGQPMHGQSMPGQPPVSSQPSYQQNMAGPQMNAAGSGMGRQMPGSMPPMSGGMPGQMAGPGSGPINNPMQQAPKKIDPDQMPSPVCQICNFTAPSFPKLNRDMKYLGWHQRNF